MRHHFYKYIIAFILLAAPATAQNSDVMDRLSELIDGGNAPVIVILDSGASNATGAAALIANRSAAGVAGPIAGSGVLAGAGGGLGYTCSGEGDSGKCTCGPNDPCIGMVDACRKLGGKTTTCDNQTKTCSCDY